MLPVNSLGKVALRGCSQYRPARSARTLSHGRAGAYAIGHPLFWLAVIVVGGTMAGKLQSAEKNNASAWLPAKAESTQALNLQATFMSRNIYPAVVVYSRPSGITQADRVKAAVTRGPSRDSMACMTA
jgi:putative drug exporter of the RND superfamily